ncbi:hypothetical protein ACUN7V_21365, partial [Quadrisphaera oryzae]
IAAALADEPGPTQIATLDALHAALGATDVADPTDVADVADVAGVQGPGGLGLSSREWTEVTAAAERCTSYLHALKLTCINGLDAAKLAENPTR